MNIVIKNQQRGECFASIFQHIKTFTEHVNIYFEKEQLYIQAMDTSRVSIFELHLPSEWFDVYEHSMQGAITIGISASVLFKILNAREKTQQIQIVYQDESDKLNIHFTSDNKSEFDKHFETTLVDIESELLSIPNTEYEAEFTVNSSSFANIMNQLKMFGESLDIKCSEEKIMLCASSVEQGKMFVEIQIDDLSEFTINEGETVELSFGLSYLHNICLYNKIAKEMEVKISSNYPLKIIYSIPGHENAKLTFYLAPKISEDS
jgi:proliferating cell nuclear antigen PCNA